MVFFQVLLSLFFFFFQAEDGIRDKLVTGVQTCALPIWSLNQRPASKPHQSATAKFAITCEKCIVRQLRTRPVRAPSTKACPCSDASTSRARSRGSLAPSPAKKM